jgi:putative transposase
MDAAALCWRSRKPPPSATGDAREQLARAASRYETKPHDGTIITDKVNEMWGTDMTHTITVGEGRAYVFVAVEHANSEVVGMHAARSADRFEALKPVRQGVLQCFGTIAPT